MPARINRHIVTESSDGVVRANLLARRVALSADVLVDDARAYVDLVFAVMAETLARGEPIEIRGLFDLRIRRVGGYVWIRKGQMQRVLRGDRRAERPEPPPVKWVPPRREIRMHPRPPLIWKLNPGLEPL